ncbi:MAG: GGDEF domain-containing protein [Campylobacterota bacterium]|nr:GGDEF domain-containing protein [Campylobacterota bacterium]
MRYFLITCLLLITFVNADIVNNSSMSDEQQLVYIIDTLRFVVKGLAVVSIILILMLIYFITDRATLKKRMLKKLEDAKNNLEESAIEDKVTKLCNKKYFDDIFNVQTIISTREKKYLNFFILEIDDFDKLIENRTQTEVEHILNQVSLSLKYYFKRSTDVIFRLEKGVFAATLVSKEEDELKFHLKKLINDIEKEDLHVSIGFKTSGIDEKLSKKSIYGMAYNALQKAKEKETDKIYDFDDTLE